MSIQIKLKNSVVQDSTPSTSDLPEVGELAVNANINSIGGFMRASNNTIVKIFGPGSLSTPTATTTVSGISELATNSETTTGTATNRVVTPAGLNAVTVAERTTSNNNYVAKAGSTLTGVLTMPNGSNSAPAINFGDSDSGIFGGTNTVSLSAGGTTRLTADTGVSVVGTLAVTGSITATSNLTIGDKIIHAGDTNTAVRFPAADTVSVETGGSEAFRVDSSGRLLVGTSTARSPGTIGAFFQIEGTTVNTSSVSATRNSADNAGANFVFNKTRGTSIGSDVVVNSGDQLGIIRFCGNDGTDSNNTAVSVSAFVDGTPGSNDMPGRLVFSTTADGASTPTDRLTIDSAGLLKIPDNGKFVAGTGGDLQIYHDGSNSYVQDIGEGKLILATNGTSINLFDSANSNTLSKFTTGGSVELYHNGNKKLETTSVGATVTGSLGIGTTSPLNTLHCHGDGTLRISPSAGVNQFESGRLRFTENTSDFQGAYIHYDGNGNIFHIGTHAANDTVVGNDLNAISIARGSGNVQIPNGRLGIGTSSVSQPLHLANSSGNTIFELQRTDSNTTGAVATISFTASDGHSVGSIGMLGDGDNEGGHIAFRTTSAAANNDPFNAATPERMRLDSSGRLLLGTTTEGVANASKFTIADTGHCGMTIRSGTSHDGQIAFSDGTSGNDEFRGQIRYNHGSNYLTFVTDATERMRIASDGKIGINEVNPVEMLHIKAEDNTDSFGGLIIKANNNSVHMKYGWRGLDANSGGDIRFAVGGSEMMRVLSSGKVGLGRTSADEMLHIKADDNSDGFGGIKIDSNNGSINCKYGWLGASGSNSFRIAVAGTERMRVASDGKVGIGTTSPQAKLDIRDDADDDFQGLRIINTKNNASAPDSSFIRLGITNVGGEKVCSIKALQESNAGNAVGLVFSTNSLGGNNSETEKMRLTSTGQLAIGAGPISLNGHNSRLSVQGTDFSSSTVAIMSNSSTVDGAYLFFAKQRSGSVGGNTSVANGDFVGQLRYLAADGTDVQSEVANISVNIDGAPGSNDTPGRITFATTNDGGNVSTERMRIHQSGAVSINTTTSYGRLHVKDNSFNPNTSTWLTNASYVASNSFGGGYCLLDGSKGYSMYCHGSGANFSIQHHTSTTATASGGVQLTNGATSWTGMSDERDKENLVTISDAITKIKTLRTVIGNYIWQPDVKHAFLIAQDVQAVLPEAVDIMNTYEETEKQRLGLRYTEVIPLLTAALQEAVAEIDTLKTKVAALEAA